MKRSLMLLLVISLGLNLGLASAVFLRTDGDERRPRRDGRPGGLSPDDSVGWQGQMERRWQDIDRRLDLEPEQRQRFRRLRLDALPLVRERMLDVRRARARLHDACRAEDLRPDSLRHLVAGMTGAQGRLDSLITETLLGELELLDPEQRRHYLRMMPLQPSQPFGRGPGRGLGGRRGMGKGRPPGGPLDAEPPDED